MECGLKRGAESARVVAVLHSGIVASQRAHSNSFKHAAKKRETDFEAELVAQGLKAAVITDALKDDVQLEELKSKQRASEPTDFDEIQRDSDPLAWIFTLLIKLRNCPSGFS